jgi:peroxiredoxin
VELPRLEPLWKNYRDKGLAMVAVEARRDTAGARKFIQENKLTFTFLENGEGDNDVCRKKYGIYLFPQTFLIDRTGRIRYFHLGFEAGDEKRIEEQIQELLKG